jgi:membrane associated rhomboid family serine protease
MSQRPNQTRLALGPPISPTVKTLIWINVWVYLAFMLVGHQLHPLGVSYKQILLSILGLHPEAVRAHFTFWQPVTYLFVHVSFFHLLFNMLGLWWFGTDLERVWGSRRFLQYYLFTGIGSGLISLIMGLPTIGASGSIYGLLFAFGMLYPNRVLYLYFLVPIKAKYFVLLFGGLELLALATSSHSGINHWAHLGGIFFGFVWFFLLKNALDPRKLIRQYKLRKAKKRLRLIVNQSEKKSSDISHPYADDDQNPTIH